MALSGWKQKASMRAPVTVRPKKCTFQKYRMAHNRPRRLELLAIELATYTAHNTLFFVVCITKQPPQTYHGRLAFPADAWDDTENNLQLHERVCCVEQRRVIP